uniref:Gypsy retrotransposon integrase-like protein 1 n=1 Tax=Cyprinus carpio TaxID=7962 RepID=A0A8C1W6U3_CYPCA
MRSRLFRKRTCANDNSVLRRFTTLHDLFHACTYLYRETFIHSQQKKMEFSGRNEKFALYNAVKQYLVDGLVDAALKKKVSRMAANFVIRESKLFYTGPSAQFMRLVVLSDEQRRPVLEECHNNPGTENHGGMRATMDRVVVGYYWDNIKADVADWVKTCHRCQKNDPIKTVSPVLHPIKVKEPWEVVGMDLIGPLKKNIKDHQYVITVTELFTKWVIAEPLKYGSSTEVKALHIWNGLENHN